MRTITGARSEIAAKASFSRIRYGQCWEDADVLLAALDIQPGETCLAIASGGDNALAMLTQNPAQVIAIDLNPAQVACLALRAAAYRTLSHPELLELVGSRPSPRRLALYARCRPLLSGPVRAFWDARSPVLAAGIGAAGKFERYFALFRERVLPLVHPPAQIERLLAGGSPRRRRYFYDQEWNTWRWRVLFRLFFSRRVMGYLGRDPRFFDYVEGSVAGRLLGRARHAAIELDPAQNPYLQWILTGRHSQALPYALRPENFEPIRANLDRLTWRCQSLEDFLTGYSGPPIDRYNLSNVFEYISLSGYHDLLDRLAHLTRPGGRLVYWNMLAPRRRPPRMASRLRSLSALARRLHQADKAFFYSRLVIEEVC